MRRAPPNLEHRPGYNRKNCDSVDYPNNYQQADHWDLNLKLEAIPEPTAIAVWSCLLVGFGAAVRSKNRNVA